MIMMMMMMMMMMMLFVADGAIFGVVVGFVKMI